MKTSLFLLGYSTTGALKCWTCNSGSIEECRSKGFYQDCDDASGNGVDHARGGAQSPEYFHEYTVVTEAGLDFDAAQQRCFGMGGYLFVPNSRDEYQHVMQLPDIENSTDQDVFWVGLKEFSGETVSVNGDERVFTNFSENEPNDKMGNEECVRMRKAGDMNDALCDITWSGPQKKNYQMGYICEVEYDAKHRSRRAAEQSSCQVEYRTRKGLLLNVQMSCKQRKSCESNKKQNFRGWKYGKQTTQCRPEAHFEHSVCRQCCYHDSKCFDQLTPYSQWSRRDWKVLFA